MKGLGIIVICVFFTFVNAGELFYDLSDAPFLFHKFIKDYNREYKDTAEILYRYAIFIEGLKKINEYNKGSLSPTYGIDLFADYTEDEFLHAIGILPNNDYKGWRVVPNDRKTVDTLRDSRYHS